MDEQERIEVHGALDRILDVAKELANQDDKHVRWKRTTLHDAIAESAGI
jgi:hypothetical protein